MMNYTKELVEKAVPANLKNSITQDLVDQLNAAATDQIIAEDIRNNFISYVGILKEGKFKISDYLNAVKFVTYRLMGDTAHDAYFKTFPDRYQNFLALGKAPKEIASFVSMYAKNLLVNKLLEQAIQPSWVLNMDMHQKALNVAYEIMVDTDVSPKVRIEASNTLLTHLAKPKEAVNNVINLDLRESSGLNDLKQTMERLAAQQQQMIQSGASTKDIAAQTIIDVEAKSHAEP